MIRTRNNKRLISIRHDRSQHVVSTSLIFVLLPMGILRVYCAMAPKLVPTHMTRPEEETAIAIMTSFLSLIGA